MKEELINKQMEAITKKYAPPRKSTLVPKAAHVTTLAAKAKQVDQRPPSSTFNGSFGYGARFDGNMRQRIENATRPDTSPVATKKKKAGLVPSPYKLK